jgi:hypothetical protein
LIAIRADEQNTQEVELTSSQVLRVGKMDGVARTMGTARRRTMRHRWISGQCP